MRDRPRLLLHMEPDAVVASLTRFPSGPLLVEEFLEGGYETALKEMSCEQRLGDVAVTKEAIDALKISRMVPDDIMDACADRKTKARKTDAHRAHHSRLSPVALFSLLFVFISTNMTVLQIGLLPYFNMSDSHASLLIHNLLVTIGPIYRARWMPCPQTAEECIQMCPNGTGVPLTAPEPVISPYDEICGFQYEETSVPAVKFYPDSELVDQMFHLTLIGDGTDMETGRSSNRALAVMTNGIKTKTLIHAALRIIILTNIHGTIIDYSCVSTAAFREIELLAEVPFLVTLNNLFSPAQRGKILLRLDRGYYKLGEDSDEPAALQAFTDRFPNLAFTVLTPNFAPTDESGHALPFFAQQHLDNLIRTSIRAQVEIANHGFKTHSRLSGKVSLKWAPVVHQTVGVAGAHSNYRLQHQKSDEENEDSSE